MLSEFSDFFRTPYVDQHAKEVPKNIVFGGAPFRCPAKAFKDTVRNNTFRRGGPLSFIRSLSANS